MGRKKEWNNISAINFNTEDYLKTALEQDDDVIRDGLTITLNKLILIVIGENNDAVKQFKQEHPSYK